jgi:hypothetical protein
MGQRLKWNFERRKSFGLRLFFSQEKDTLSSGGLNLEKGQHSTNTYERLTYCKLIVTIKKIY